MDSFDFSTPFLDILGIISSSTQKIYFWKYLLNIAIIIIEVIINGCRHRLRKKSGFFEEEEQP